MTDRTTDNILRLPAVRARSGLGRSTIYRKMEAGTFPRSFPLSTAPDGRVIAAGWYESDINAWVADPTGWKPAEAA